jgi:outer membrane immunogenic protein
MKKITITLASVAALIGTPVLAADMAVKARPAPPVIPPPVYSWTGCYLGGNVGGAWQHNSTFDAVAIFDTGGDHGSSVIGGAQVGCDYQFASNWVIGIQGMFDWTDINSSHLYPGTTTETLGIKTKWVDTLTGRIGYTVWPQTLLYFKGGGAWARVDYSDADPINGGFPYAGQASVARSGWTVGGGVEYAFLPNWSAFAEYDYIDLGNRNVSLTYSCVGGCGFQNPYIYTVSHNISEFLVGINYRFGWLAGR